MEIVSVRPLSADLIEKAKSELNENPMKIYDDLEALRSWLSKQPHITARTDDQFLIAFLRGCKYSLERAKKKIDTYYTIRSAIPEFFQSRDSCSPKLQAVLSLGLSVPLLPVDSNIGQIWIIRQGAYDPSKVTVLDIINVNRMIGDMLMWDDDSAVICGHVVIIDLQHFALGHITQWTPTLIKNVVSAIQTAYPFRQKSIHFVNMFPLFEALFKVVHNCVTSKMKKRVFVHDSLDDLHKHVSKELLPTEYGGSAGTLQSFAAGLKDKLMQRRNDFIEDEKYRTNESMRPDKPKTSETLFGTVGSFRKLDFD